MGEAAKELKALKEELNKLKDERLFKASLPLQQLDGTKKLVTKFEERRHMTGHFGKVYSVSWFPDGVHLASIAQDGKAILWDAFTNKKIRVVSLRTSWIMDVNISPDGKLMASGGLDNICTVHNIGGANPSENDKPPIVVELNGHEGFLSTCTFINNDTIVSAGGDGTCRIWNIERPDDHEIIYNEMKAEVMAAEVSADRNLLCTGSTDSMVRVYDFRDSKKREIFSFIGHESDVNSVKFFPDSQAIGSCSDDATARLFDLKSTSQMNVFSNDRILCGAARVEFSQSGRLLFVSYDDFNTRVWDAVTADCIQELQGHKDRVSSVKLSPNGTSVCTASWDQTLKIWA